MIRLVTSNNAELIEHLDSERMARLELARSTAEHSSAIEELIRTKRPDIALIDAELRGGSGFQLARTIRADPSCNDVRLILILPSVLTRADLETVSQCGVDDVITMPLTADDLFHHLVAVAGKSYRRNERIEVGLDVTLQVGDATLEALVLNMSRGGLGVRTDVALTDGEMLHAVLRLKDTDGENNFPPARATVAWTRNIGGDHIAGLCFAEVPVRTRLLIDELCLFEVIESPLGGVRAYIHGDVIATTNLEHLAHRLADADPIELNLREIEHMSSAGVRQWCQLIATLHHKRLSFRHASIPFVTQAALAPMVLGHGEVLSFEAPYHCDTCERDDIRLLDASAIIRRGDEFVAPTLRCPTCGGELEFDELPWRYFAFMLRG